MTPTTASHFFVSDFVNLKIKPTQSFEYTHSVGYAYVFINVSTHTYKYLHLYYIFFLNRLGGHPLISLSPSPLPFHSSVSPFRPSLLTAGSSKATARRTSSLSLSTPSRRGVESRSVSPTVSDLGRLSPRSYSWFSP
jgi:hypothetical protein